MISFSGFQANISSHYYLGGLVIQRSWLVFGLATTGQPQALTALRQLHMQHLWPRGAGLLYIFALVAVNPQTHSFQLSRWGRDLGRCIWLLHFCVRLREKLWFGPNHREIWLCSIPFVKNWTSHFHMSFIHLVLYSYFCLECVEREITVSMVSGCQHCRFCICFLSLLVC